jgi:hypothetical protein
MICVDSLSPSAAAQIEIREPSHHLFVVHQLDAGHGCEAWHL